MRIAAYLILAHLGLGCNDAGTTGLTTTTAPAVSIQFKKVGEISPPEGTIRITAEPASFAAWLRNLDLRKDNRLYLYNREPKSDQSKHFAVIDMSIGDKDLQHCADAIMRLRAEYFYKYRQYDSIVFFSSRKTPISFAAYMKGHRYFLSENQISVKLVAGASCESRPCFLRYMETVFAFSGTYNLYEQLQPKPIRDLQVGDVFIKPGSPGHAMIVADAAVNPSNGKRFFMLAQSYMPAQDIHIVINPRDSKSPWFELKDSGAVITPHWKFQPGQLRSWN